MRASIAASPARARLSIAASAIISVQPSKPADSRARRSRGTNTSPLPADSSSTWRTPAAMRTGDSRSMPSAAASLSAERKPMPHTSNARRYGFSRTRAIAAAP